MHVDQIHKTAQDFHDELAAVIGLRERHLHSLVVQPAGALAVTS